jgi:hypothetical protein
LLNHIYHLNSDRVFNPECSTRQVYEEGAKQVALSVLTGINCMHARILPAVYSIVIHSSSKECKFYACCSVPMCCSKHICVWSDEQWEDVHHGRHHGA